ncbi:ester cyclase [Pedobacter cryoconitis]|uniref:Putative ester cyclase n=1 Tax=Pedobacter cryoconitis TaxID=188932 RepID=A0A7X0J4Z4_9SPHI|nr:ester cyclase [Pedobacter cryoconitis]MBB6500452.1 putative ester cyclase [Pedobacter cryoconitis]
MESQLKKNKEIVKRFNLEVIEQGNLESFEELMDDQFINQTAPGGMDSGPKGMIHTFNNILRPAFPDLKVIIHEQIAEGDLVTTRKTIEGTHLGSFIGIPATGKKITIQVIDVVRIVNDKYYEHWGMNTMHIVLAELSSD